VCFKRFHFQTCSFKTCSSNVFVQLQLQYTITSICDWKLMQTSEWICNKLEVHVATNFEWKLQQSTNCGWNLLQKPAVGDCNKLRSEVATNCVWKVPTNCEYNLQQSTNCGCKLQRTAIGICNQLWLQSPRTTNCCGWKLKLQRTAVENGNKLRMEVATNYRLRFEIGRKCG